MSKGYHKIIKLFCVIICCTSLVGCWNYREVNELSLVSGVAIDLDKKDEKYIVSIETIVPKGGTDVELNSGVISMKGDTIFEIVRDLIMKNSKRLYWSHANVAILNAGLAKNGLISVLDFLYRDAEIRADTFLVIATDSSAKRMFYSKFQTHDTTSMHIAQMMENQDSIGKFEAIELWRFQDFLIDKGIEPVLPVVKMAVEKEEEMPKVIGMAVFKKDKMLDIINEIESRSLLFLKNRIKTGVIVVKDVGQTNANVTLEIFANKTKVKPIIREGKLVMKINIEVDTGIAELGKNIDFISKEGQAKLKKDAQKLIKYQVNSLIVKAQQEYQSDIFGFGSIIRREMPYRWNQVEESWPIRFANLKYETKVKINIRSSSLISKPVLLGD